MLRFADLAEINPPRKARLEMPGPIAPGRACPGSAVSDSGAAPLRGGAGKLPPAPLGWQSARPSPSNPQGGSRRRQNRLGLNVGEKAEQLCKKGGHSCRERVWPQLLGGAARLGSILKGQKGWRRQPVPRRTPAGRAGVGTGRSRTMLSGIWAEGLLSPRRQLKSERSPGRGEKKPLTCAIFHNMRRETLMGSAISRRRGSPNLSVAHETQQQHAIPSHVPRPRRPPGPGPHSSGSLLSRDTGY